MNFVKTNEVGTAVLRRDQHILQVVAVVVKPVFPIDLRMRFWHHIAEKHGSHLVNICLSTSARTTKWIGVEKGDIVPGLGIRRYRTIGPNFTGDTDTHPRKPDGIPDSHGTRKNRKYAIHLRRTLDIC